LPAGKGPATTFEEGILLVAAGGNRKIEKEFGRGGVSRVAQSEKFIVSDKYGPLREGELDRARAWGGELRVALGKTPAAV